MKQIMVFLCVIILASCEWRPAFEFYIEPDFTLNGRSLYFNVPAPIDLSDTSQWIKPFDMADTAKYSCSISNMLNYKPFEKVKVPEWSFYKVMPYYFHRSVGGRIDTLYKNEGIGLGYLSRYYADKKWFVVEIKWPGLTHGYEDLVDSATLSKPLTNVFLADYTYEGQRKIFESDESNYWIVARKSRHLYGPFTEKEILREMPKLGIKLPVKLIGLNDRYAIIQAPEMNPHYNDRFPFKLHEKTERPDKILKLIP